MAKLHNIVNIICAPLAQLDRASGFGPEGRGFESLRAYHGSVAQLAEQLPLKQLVVGSSPTGPTNNVPRFL